MNAIRIHTRIDSETLHLPELRPLIGKAVEIVVREEALSPVPPAPNPGCFDQLPTHRAFNPPELEAMQSGLSNEQFQALQAIASQGGPDVEAIAEFRAASIS